MGGVKWLNMALSLVSALCRLRFLPDEGPSSSPEFIERRIERLGDLRGSDGEADGSSAEMEGDGGTKESSPPRLRRRGGREVREGEGSAKEKLGDENRPGDCMDCSDVEDGRKRGLRRGRPDMGKGGEGEVRKEDDRAAEEALDRPAPLPLFAPSNEGGGSCAEEMEGVEGKAEVREDS